MPAFAVMWRQGTSFIGDRLMSVGGLYTFPSEQFRVEAGTEWRQSDITCFISEELAVVYFSSAIDISLNASRGGTISRSSNNKPLCTFP